MDVKEELKKHKISILIPTIKTNVESMIESIKSTMGDLNYEIVASCINTCASKNRNWCLLKSTGDVIVYLDDDTGGFYPNWCVDLLKPLIEHPDKISMVAPRLLNKDGQIGCQLGDSPGFDDAQDYQKAIHTPQTGLNITCSACIAYFRNDILWEEDYIRACYEDASFCMLFKKKFPEKDIVIVNRCKIIHYGEAKARTSDAMIHNKNLFSKRWGVTI